MITLTDDARLKIQSLFPENSCPPIRIYAKSSGDAASRLALKSGEITETDSVHDVGGGLVFCLSRNLEKLIGGVSVTFSGKDLVIEALNPLPQTGYCCESRYAESADESPLCSSGSISNQK